MKIKFPLSFFILVVAIALAFSINTAFAKPNAKAFKKMLDAHSKAPKVQKRNFHDIASAGALVALGLTSPAADGPPEAIKSRFSPTPTGNTTFTPIVDQQSETTIAVHGLNVVSGFNDFRGFAVNSVSGVAYSTDGGLTFTDNNQLPLDGSGNDFVGGDPDVKVWQDPNTLTVYFFYSSIYFPDGVTSSLSVHVSTDGGATWSPPRVVTAASSTLDFADKEYISVDQETGRIVVSWSNFKADGTIEMAAAYSDDQGQTWSPKISIANRTTNNIFDGQGTITRSDPNGSNYYIAWRTFGLVFPFGNGISVARSTDNGATWSPPIDLAVNDPSPEAAFGFDRVNGNPALAVDPATGEVYIAYIRFPKKQKDPNDNGDLVFRRSTNGGLTWSKPEFIGRSPKKNNRTQMFPWMDVDEVTGTLSIIWYDQRRGTGVSDLTETYHVHSFDKGLTFTCPEAASETPYQSEFGNNFNAPHQGDYIQNDSENGILYASYAAPPRDPAFGDSMIDFEVVLQTPGPGLGATPGDILVNGVVGGIVDPGTTMSLIVPLRSNCGKLGSVDATLISKSADATVLVGNSTYKLKKKFTNNTPPYQVSIAPTATPGQYLDFELDLNTTGLNTAGGTLTGVVRFRLNIGQPGVGPAFVTEDFESVVPPALPAGWIYVPIFGTGSPWMTVASSGNPGIGAFVANIDTNSFDRLQSPFFPLPGGVNWYDIEFDINYNTENATARTGFDGASLTLRFNGGGSSIFASAFAVEFDNRYEHRLERDAGGQSGDRSAYSGNSGGYRHVRIRIPAKDVLGVDLTSIQLRFDMTVDSSVGAVGVTVDNVTIKPVNKTDP